MAKAKTKAAATENPTVEAEVLAVTSVKRKKSETPAKYRARLIQEANQLADGDWEKLSEPAQEWINAGVEALEAKNEVPNFPDAAEEAEEPAAEEKPAKKTGKAGKRSGTAAAKAPKAGTGKRGGAIKDLYLIMCKNPDWDRAQIQAEAEKRGIEVSPATVSTEYYAAQKCMNALRELKLLK